MKAFIKKLTAVMLALSLGIFSFAVPQTETAVAKTSASAEAVSFDDGQKTDEGAAFLSNIIGEYVPLFVGATFDAKYDHYWHDYSVAVVGESMADMAVEMMKKSIGASAYGDEAGEEFCCGFINDVVRISFAGKDGSEVTFTLKDGTEVKHSYSYVKTVQAKGVAEGQEMAMDGHLFASNDDNKDEFAYLYMCPDTPATTFHLEFRYGSDEESLLKLTDGKYKNWLAAGFPAGALNDPAEVLLSQVIGLFTVENLSMMSTAEASEQRRVMSGIWDMDTSAFKDFPGYEKASMYISLSKNGMGKSFVDMTGSGEYVLASTYPFYIDVHEGKSAVSGCYLVMSEDEGFKNATYEISEKDGKRTLTFHSAEGDIVYYYREGIAPETPAISKAKAKNKTKVALAWKEVEDADGYEIVISAGKNFKKTKTVTVEGKTKATVKKLGKKSCFVKIRAYTVDYAGNKVYSDYSKVKKIKSK